MSEVPEVPIWPSNEDVMTGRIVVGYDGSDHARTAVRWAARQAQHRGLPLVVVCVVDVTTLVLPPPGTPVTHWSDVAFDYAQALAREGVQLARGAAPGVAASGVVGSGSPAQILVRASHAAGLVVVGSRGRGDLAALCMGSVSTSVVRHAECATVVVRGADPNVPGPDHDVVVGIDGSAWSRRALDAAADIAVRDGARLRVVTAWTRSPRDSLLPTLSPRWSDLVTHMAQTAVEGARRAAAAAGHHVTRRHPGLQVSEVVVEGPPAAVLAEQSLGAGLLVVGSRGLGTARSLLLGSVSHGIVHAASCPVEVVRPTIGVPDRGVPAAPLGPG